MKIQIESLSLLDIREKYGLGSSGFYDNTWWLNEPFAKEKPEAGEYEINFHKELVNLTFDEQKKKIKKCFEVAHPAIVAQAVLKHFKETGERLCENYYVRTSSMDSDGHRVNLGGFDATGLKVNDSWGVYRCDDLAVSSARKLRNLKPRKIEPLEPLNFDIKEVYINGVKFIRDNLTI